MPDSARTQTGKRLLRSSMTVGAMTMISRVAGLVRDVVLATMFGAAANADAFYIAFRIPQFLRRLFAEGAFSQAFVPVLSEYRATRSVAEVKVLVDAVSGVLGAALLSVTALIVIAAPVVTLVFAPGFLQMPEKMALTTQLIRITFPYLFLISMTGFAGAVLNSYARFAVPAFTPVFLNLTLIAGAVLASPYFAEPTFALAWAVLVAGLVQLVFQIPFIARIGMLPRPRFDIASRGGAPHPEADAAGAVRGVGQPDQSAARYRARLVSANRKRVLAVFFRAPDRIAAGRVRHRDRDGDPAGPVTRVLDPVRRGIPPYARLGDQDDLHDRAAGEFCAADSCPADTLHLVPVWSAHRA